MSKVEGRGVQLTPPSRLRITIFSSRLLGLNCSHFLIFLNSGLVAQNNTCKMALFQRPMAMIKLNSNTFCFHVYFNLCTRIK